MAGSTAGDGMKITIDLKASLNSQVRVENYRSIYKPWEGGTVERISIHIRYDGVPYVIYDVRLHRLSRGYPMFLHVGDDGIEPR